jgi:hypothetical protein
MVQNYVVYLSGSPSLNLCLELTVFTAGASSQLGLLKHTQLFLNNQLLPAIQVGRYASLEVPLG